MKNIEIKEIMYQKEDEIIEKIEQAMKDVEGYPQGYHIDVVLDTDTNQIYTTSALSQNSMTTGQFEGSCVTIATCHAWAVGMDGYDYDFSETLKCQDEYVEIEKAFLESNEYDLYDYVTGNYPEIIERMDNNHKDYIISNFNESAIEKFDRFINDLEEFNYYNF